MDFLIGHSTDAEMGTGVTVILSKEGATGGVSVRGSAPGTRETDLLKCGNAVERINAVVLSGGSAYGLEASSGVMDYLREIGVGYRAGAHIVPIVCGAVLFDLDYKSFAFPDKQAGYQAAKNARPENYISGNIGAGTGATVGKILGMDNCTKGGIGVHRSVTPDGAEVVAIVAVNALGDIYDNEGRIIAGAKSDGRFIDTVKLMTSGAFPEPKLTNTTIGCILTNARLTKEQANKLADITHDAFAMNIRPVHTMLDGDTIFVMAEGSVDTEFLSLCVMAVETMRSAIVKAVK